MKNSICVASCFPCLIIFLFFVLYAVSLLFCLFYLFAFCFLIYVKKTLKEIFTYFIYFKKIPSSYQRPGSFWDLCNNVAVSSTGTRISTGMPVLGSACATHPVWRSLPQMFQFPLEGRLPSPSTSSTNPPLAFGISQAFCVPSF